MSSIISLVILFLIIICSYYGVVHIVKLYTGCDSNEAIAKIHGFLNGNHIRHMEEDFGLLNDIWFNIKNIIGEAKYKELESLSQTAIDTPLLFFNYESGLNYIGISVFYKDETEKKIIENTVINIVKRYLRIYGYNTTVMLVWKERYDLQMPYLQVRYAKSAEEKYILDMELKDVQCLVQTRNNPVIDETEDDLIGE